MADHLSPMGMGATNILGRVSSSILQGSPVQTSFCSSLDVPNGGVLFSLPALLATGLLLYSSKYFQLPNGYYSLDSIFLLLAFMALVRAKTVESLRFVAPGEWGKLLGLDRIPEARTVRDKIHLLSQESQVTEWSRQLSSNWIADQEEVLASFYIDGHVRVYYGSKTELPQHYVSRQRLCLRATTDYWVNAMDGQPFLVINKAIDPGMLKVLEEDIVPRLEKEIPDSHQVGDPHYHRFTLIFDREGYSPQFLLTMKSRHIACLTYHKYPGEDWREEEFTSHSVTLVGGNTVEMKLGERGIYLGKKIWVREIRKLSEGGHQTAILSTDYISPMTEIAPKMFARWSQENFFGYMRSHYNLDRLANYELNQIPDTTQVVNPAHRAINSEIRKRTAVLNRILAQFGSVNLDGEINPKKVSEYEQEKAKLQEEIQHKQKEIEELKTHRKTIPSHIKFSDLPKENQFKQIHTPSQDFIDTIKMIAYRAETAMVNILREKMSRLDDARSLIRAIYSVEADIIPSERDGILGVYLHHLANHSSDAAVQHLCDEINKTKTIFPGTNLQLSYFLGSKRNPRLQEV